jgi:flagella basal body P-ring formation protein FlgA
VFKKKIRYLLIIISIICVCKDSLALSGKDITEKISEWLLLEGVAGEPIFSKTSIYKDCSSNFQITKVFKTYKTVKISCLDENGIKLIVRVNLKKSEQKLEQIKGHKYIKKRLVSKLKKKKIKIYKSIRLKRALEKNSVIKPGDIDLIISTKLSENSFFIGKIDLVGRKLKKNLKMGQLLHPRHLYEKFEIQIGDYLSIVSYVGSVAVTVSGEAVDAGNLGDLIKVKNLRSGNVIKGYVNKNKKIRVFR